MPLVEARYWQASGTPFICEKAMGILNDAIEKGK
jgi:hypothetical protein